MTGYQRILRPEFRVLQEPRLQRAQFRRKSTAEFPAASLVGGKQDADLVVAESVGVKFPDVVRGIIGKEPAHVGIPEREGKAAGAAVLIGEIETVVVIAAVGDTVEVVDAVVIQRAVYREPAGMVVNHVEGDGDAMDVAQINQHFQLRRPRCDVFKQQRRCCFAASMPLIVAR